MMLTASYANAWITIYEIEINGRIIRVVGIRPEVDFTPPTRSAREEKGIFVVLGDEPTRLNPFHMHQLHVPGRGAESQEMIKKLGLLAKLFARDVYLKTGAIVRGSRLD